MNQLLCQHVKDLKSALLTLSATGEKGFEGLIGTALREISGVPFRLAGSGSQFGVDGKPTYEGDAICFEGKRYDGKLPRTEVLSKIAELSITDNEIDIWVLGATSHIRSQLADGARSLGAKNGIVVLILDWSKTDLPPLAVALSMGGMRIQEFLKNNIRDGGTLSKALESLQTIRNSQDFASHAERIRSQCNEPTVGLALAQRANTEWLTDAFSSRKVAKMKFGQPLSPGDTDTANVRQRKALIAKLRPYLNAAPDEKIVCVLGGEGHGKSWIVAQSWLDLEHKPLMVFMRPDDFAEAAVQIDVVELLISKLIKQTGNGGSDETTRKRWRRRLKQWRGQSAVNSPRLIVVIDGINQRPKSHWARIIESIGNELNQLGGRLVVTSRTQYFRDRVQAPLSLGFNEISVPEWTDSERDEILAGHDIRVLELHRDVANSLRNPRLLGIALELLNKADVASFEELSVSRLLFEHIRVSERDAPEPQPAQVFARQLQKHASEIISRVNAKQQDDLNIFEEEMGAVADGRFYQTVDGDSTRYSLQEDGLTLALGFAVIDRLRTAQRNQRNLDATLEEILEPVAALDDTADVILAALTVSAADKRNAQDIVASLVKGFASLQNPDQGKFIAFVGLAKSQPQGFMDAAHALCLAGIRQPNFDWIQGALIAAGRNSCTWQKMVDKVHTWLSVCSLSPECGIFWHDSQKKVQEEREKNRKKIEEKLQKLSASERAILDNLPKEEGPLSRLSRLALMLLAGKSLATFAKSLMNWSFSYALNADHNAPDKDFKHLVRLNRVDWSQTRSALLDVSAELREADVSATGKRALVNILRATGHSDDGKEAQSLVADLTKDCSHIRNPRRIETYCSADPCDPSSEQPDNVTQTAEQYAAINVSKLRQLMGQTLEDLFFDMARTGIARFKPDVAVAKHREFAVDVLRRTGLPLRRGVFELRPHNALLTINEAREFINKWESAKTSRMTDGLSEKDAWLVSQYLLLLAFPFISAWEQTVILLSNEADEDILLDLANLAKPLDAKQFESLVAKACGENNGRQQYLLLALANSTSVKLSAVGRKQIMACFSSNSERVRALSLCVIAKSGDEDLLCFVVDSEWRANDSNEIGFENWYGSTALLEAAKRGLIPHDKVLDRISARLYGRAAAMLDKEAVCDIAHRIDASINQVVGLDGDLVAPDIEFQVHPSLSYEHRRFSVGERTSEAKDIKEAMSWLSESSEAFELRQKSNYDASLEFKAKLTKAKASIILDHIGFEEFSAVVAASEELADRWYRLFMNIEETKLAFIYNFIILLAHALGEKFPDKAENLFRRVKDSNPLVRFTFGSVRIQLDPMAIWAGIRSPALDALRFARLDRMATDHDLSMEVLAALLNGQQELLTSYIEAKLRSEEPAEISRGIMVAGFSDLSKFNDNILKKYEGCSGLIGSAQNAAKYAYERNVWARHWYEKMCQTDENTDFWRYAILFLKIVDRRFAVWRSTYPQKCNPIQTFSPALLDEIEHRYGRWENHRKKKLFGSDAPASIFLEK